MDTTMPEAAINKGRITKFKSIPPATRMLEPRTIDPMIEPKDAAIKYPKVLL